MAANAEALKITIPEGTKPIRAINRELLGRRLETDRKLMRRGFIFAGLGVVALAAASIAAPIVGLGTAVVVTAEAGWFAITGGTGVGLFGALKNAIDKRRRM